MLNFEEQVNLGISLLKWNVDVSELKTIDLNSKGIPAVYIYEPIKGGKSICVTNKGETLVGNSAKSLDDLVEELKNGKRSGPDSTRSVKCPKCGNVTQFDMAKIPAGAKFDYRCSNCGRMNMIKLTQVPADMVQSTIDFFNQEFFTIEDKRDPIWEKMCQQLADELIKIMATQGKSVHYIMVKLNGLNISEIEKILIENNIALPDAKATKESVLRIFEQKLKKMKKHLEAKQQGMKW